MLFLTGWFWAIFLAIPYLRIQSPYVLGREPLVDKYIDKKRNKLIDVHCRNKMVRNIVRN